MALLEGTPVAVKKLNDQNLTMDLLEGFRRELEIFHKLQVRTVDQPGRLPQGDEPLSTSVKVGIYPTHNAERLKRRCAMPGHSGSCIPCTWCRS